MKLPTDEDFRRNTTPEVYEAYKEYLKTGNYPYLDNVTDWIADKYGVGEQDKKQLHHEVYIASSMYRLEKMVNLENELKEKGFTPITEFDFKDGDKIILQGRETPLRIRRDSAEHWFGFPPKHSRTGVNLSLKMYEHKAYERAKTLGRLNMAGEAVIMVKEA